MFREAGGSLFGFRGVFDIKIVAMHETPCCDQQQPMR